MKKIKRDTILYYIEDALVEIDKVISGCKNNSLDEGEYFALMEHAFHMFNFAFNARFLSRKEISEFSQKQRDKLTLPPYEIFEVGKPKKKNKRVKRVIPN